MQRFASIPEGGGNRDGEAPAVMRRGIDRLDAVGILSAARFLGRMTGSARTARLCLRTLYRLQLGAFGSAPIATGTGGGLASKGWINLVDERLSESMLRLLAGITEALGRTFAWRGVFMVTSRFRAARKSDNKTMAPRQ